MTSRSLRADTVERRFVEQEHREIAAGVDRILHVAELAGSLSSPDLRDALRDLLAWLERSLEPHISWEEQWLYPRLDEIADSTWPARLMSFEHQQIRRQIAVLDGDREALRHEPTHQRLVDLRGHLYALDALIRAHIEREDRFLLPILDEPRTMPAPTPGPV